MIFNHILRKDSNQTSFRRNYIAVKSIIMGDFIIPGDRKQNSESEVKGNISLFREWLENKRLIFVDTQRYDDATLLDGIISMYDDVFNYTPNKNLSDAIGKLAKDIAKDTIELLGQ